MGREFDSDCEPQVRERPRTDNRGSSGVGTDQARRAGRAVEWRFQFAQQIMMLERRCREEDGVNRQPDERQPPVSEVRGTYLLNTVRLKPDTTYHGPAKAGHYVR